VPNGIAIFRRNPPPPPNGGVECKWGRQKLRFRAYLALVPAVSAATYQVLSTGSPVGDGHRLAGYDTSLVVLKPNAQRKTELNSTELFSSVQFSFPLCIESATSCNGHRNFLTVKNRRPPSPVVAARRRFSSNDRHCVDWPIHKCVPIVKNLRQPPISSPSRRKSPPVQCTARETELN